MSKYKAVERKWNPDVRRPVCANCGKDTITCYIATGHDHTDDRADMCDCGAGIPFAEFYEEVKNPTHALSYYKEYL